MVIEWLKFRVAPEFREPFIQIDADIWTRALEGYPGFLGKMVWISPIDLTEIILVIRWATREEWKAVPQTDIDQIDQQFDQAIDFDYEFVDAKEYQVRRFPTTPRLINYPPPEPQ